MDWLISYRDAEGQERSVTVRSNHLPNHKTAARCVVEHAYGDAPPRPLGNLSAVAWLTACGLEIRDISLVRDDRPGLQPLTFSRPRPYFRQKPGTERQPPEEPAS
ncbi:hypothetical protein [Pseudomonas tohonis]|uniref:hypothetical protein n=1 Tax=Pseudomonas tohonis TaxID=2725477 RepID=UPI001F36078C|nr:hypothetical protein [Pseudomonas tohonis]